jgi:hypothetical protein
MFLSKVDSFETSGKLTSEQAEELRQLGTALKNDMLMIEMHWLTVERA